MGNCDRLESTWKSWFYQDRLLKPEKEIIHGSVSDGGLGKVSIYFQAKANLITSFMKTATFTSIKTYLYLNSLYEFYVNNVGDKMPQCLPYYYKAFFATLMTASKEESDIKDYKWK